MKSAGERAGKTWLDASSEQWKAFLRDREEQVFLVLTLLIGAIVGMVVVAFILLTERFGARLSRRRDGMAKAARACSWPSRHGLFALSLFSRCSGEWSSANEGCPARARRPYFTRHGLRKVLLHFRDACQRDSARPRRSGGSSGCGDRFGAWQKTRVATRKREGTRARGGGGRSRSGIQYANGGGAVLA